MKPIVYIHPRCTTCKRAMQFLDNHQIEYEVKDLLKETPPIEMLRQVWQSSGLMLKKFFNYSGMKYRELKMSERLKTMSDEEQLQTLADDGMMIKRPLLIADEGILIGFKEPAWREFFKI